MILVFIIARVVTRVNDATYPRLMSSNMPLMPMFIVLSTQPLGDTSSSKPRLHKRDNSVNAANYQNTNRSIQAQV